MSFHLKRDSKPKDTQEWMMTYSDVVTLLLTFFVMILSISSVDQAKVEKMQKSIATILLKKDYVQPFSDLKDRIKAIIENKNLSSAIEVETDNLGVKIRFSSHALYRSGSADILPTTLPFLDALVKEIQSGQYPNYFIAVEGHTDDIPIRTRQFPSNWELSSARATHVVRYFIQQGISKDKIKAIGYGDSRPEKPHRDMNGRRIKENLAANRRVEIYIHRTGP